VPAEQQQLQPAAIANLLAALERVDAQEQEIEARWFGPGLDSGGCGSSDAHASAAPAAVDGVPSPAGGADEAAAIVPELQQPTEGCLGADAVESIKAGRRHFLRHTPDGGRAGGAEVPPTQVVEGVSQLLLDDLLLWQALDMDAFVDTLCDQLIVDEFEDA
jgi:hypothetical protein